MIMMQWLLGLRGRRTALETDHMCVSPFVGLVKSTIGSGLPTRWCKRELPANHNIELDPHSVEAKRVLRKNRYAHHAHVLLCLCVDDDGTSNLPF